jgi:S1-C subfamily serine protease
MPIELVPEPTVTSTIIGSVLGDRYYQLSASATGADNSGGSVLNANGDVIGIFTSGGTLGGDRLNFAVPISFGRDLLKSEPS